MCLGSTEALWRTVGFSADGGLCVANKYSETSITRGWRLDVSYAEKATVLFIALFARVGGTMLEEKHGSKRFGPRRYAVKKYLELLIRDGAFKWRMFVLMTVLAQILTMPAEMAYFGYNLEVQRKADTPENAME